MECCGPELLEWSKAINDAEVHTTLGEACRQVGDLGSDERHNGRAPQAVIGR